MHAKLGEPVHDAALAYEVEPVVQGVQVRPVSTPAHAFEKVLLAQPHCCEPA